MVQALHTVRVQQLTQSAFAPFGRCTNLFTAAPLGASSLMALFYREAQQLGLSPAGQALVDVCTAAPRRLVVDALECVGRCVRGLLPLDGDVLLQVAPASPVAHMALDALAVFHVPRGTLCTLWAGVWHYAPYPLGRSPVSTLLVQPEPVPWDDVQCVCLPQWLQVGIEV